MSRDYRETINRRVAESEESNELRSWSLLATNPWVSRNLAHGQTPPAPLYVRWTSFFIRPAVTPRADFETTGSPSTKTTLAFGATKIKRHPRYPCKLYDPGPCADIGSTRSFACHFIFALPRVYRFL